MSDYDTGSAGEDPHAAAAQLAGVPGRDISRSAGFLAAVVSIPSGSASKWPCCGPCAQCTKVARGAGGEQRAGAFVFSKKAVFRAENRHFQKKMRHAGCAGSPAGRNSDSIAGKYNMSGERLKKRAQGRSWATADALRGNATCIIHAQKGGSRRGSSRRGGAGGRRGSLRAAL